MSSELDAFREKALRAMDDLNARIDGDKEQAREQRAAELAARGAERTRAALRWVKVGIATVVAVAAAVASVWDLMKLAAELGASAWWGVAAGGAIDLGWVYLLLEVYSHREDPAKALKPYRRTGSLLVVSAILNGLSGVLTGGRGHLGMLVLGAISVIMPLMLKAVITPLVLGKSLTGELLVSRGGRSRVAGAARDRRARALEAFDAAYRLESERAEHAAQIELQRQRARYEAEREAVALEFQGIREELTRAAYAASGIELPQQDAAPAVAPAAPTASGETGRHVASATDDAEPAETCNVASATDDDADDDAEPLEPPTLASLSKADAVRIALRRRPDYSARQVADLLGGYGVTVADSYVRQIRLRDGAAATAELPAVVPIRKAE
jgi:hypothetical protein